MRLCSVFTVSPAKGQDALLLQELHLTTAAVEIELTRDSLGSVLRVWAPVRREGLKLVQGKSSREPWSITVPEANGAAQYVSDVIAALAFLTGVGMSLAVRGDDQDRLIPDNQHDSDLLAEFGTDRIHREYHALLNIRTFSLGAIDRHTIERLLERRAGLHLFHEAMHLERPVAKYRELWRVLESAFGCQNDDLVDLLADYAPARELKFTRDELKVMLVLRGRASHAATKGGVNELRAATAKAERAIGRLACLVEQVILTKKSWGCPTMDVERYAPLTSFVGPEGAVNLFRPPT